MLDEDTEIVRGDSALRDTAMEQDDLEALQGLHQDLIAVSNSQLRNVDRLWNELDARIEEFRQLLDKPRKNDASREMLSSGMFSLLILSIILTDYT